MDFSGVNAVGTMHLNIPLDSLFANQPWHVPDTLKRKWPGGSIMIDLYGVKIAIQDVDP